MAEIEITDEASLEAWLKTRPRRDAEIIAFRAAARVFPLWGRAMEEEWANEYDLDALPALRFLLSIFWVAEKRTVPLQELELLSVCEYVEEVTKNTIKRNQFWRDIKDDAALRALESLKKTGTKGAISAAYIAPNIFFENPDDDEGASFLAERGNDSVKTFVRAIAQDANVLPEIGKLKSMPL